MKSEKSKVIKIQYSSRCVSADYWYPEYIQVPKIQLVGKWLQELGYNVGDKLSVVCDNEGIHLKPFRDGT